MNEGLEKTFGHEYIISQDGERTKNLVFGDVSGAAFAGLRTVDDKGRIIEILEIEIMIRRRISIC